MRNLYARKFKLNKKKVKPNRANRPQKGAPAFMPNSTATRWLRHFEGLWRCVAGYRPLDCRPNPEGV